MVNLRSLVVVSLVGGVGFTLLSPPPAGTREAEPHITFNGLTPQQVEIAKWAADLFDQARLDLPPIDFVRHPTDAPCRGRNGIASYEQGRGQVGICTPSAGGVEEFLFLHEMAHTWDRHSLSDDRRQAFRELRGVAAWRSAELQWGELGSEQAAEIIAWGLIDRPIWVVRIPLSGCTDLRAGYMTLTGREPLHGYTDYCARSEP